MTEIRTRFVEIGAVLFLAPLGFMLCNLLLDGRLHITDFEAGALVGIVGIKLIEILRVVFRF